MPHKEGAPVWVRVGKADHHAHIVSAAAVAGGSGAEPASYVVRWSNGSVQEVGSPGVRPDEGGRGRSRRPPAAVCREANRHAGCADGSGGGKQPAKRGKDPPRKRGAGGNHEEKKASSAGCDDISPLYTRYAVGEAIKKVSRYKSILLLRALIIFSHCVYESEDYQKGGDT